MAIKIPPNELLTIYASGWFPMATPGGDLQLFSPDPRGVIPLDAFRVPHGSKKIVADPAWETRLDTCFAEVVSACAQREETWIDDRIFTSYCDLHAVGHAHSVEIWKDGCLAGGLYGVRLGAAFFGESMFNRIPGASKAALVQLVAILQERGFLLLDIQWTTPHLALFGATAIPRQNYLDQLRRAVATNATWPGSSRQSARWPCAGT